MSKAKTCCFTGHRPKAMFGYDRALYAPLMQQLCTCIDQLYQAGYTCFITGGAQGFDQLVFWAVDAVKQKHPDIKNVVYIPFKGQELRWLATGIFSQEEYRNMLSKADMVKVISNENSVSALFERNEAMIEDSDGILCLYEDDSWQNPKQSGGTASAMRSAYMHAMDIWQLCFDNTKAAPYPIKLIQECVFK